MKESGLKQARELTSKGFYYDNLIDMANNCKAENHPEKILVAYVLNRFFTQLADEVGEGPVMSNNLRKLEVRYRTAVNHALEKAIAGVPQEEQDKRLIDLIMLLWKVPDKK